MKKTPDRLLAENIPDESTGLPGIRAWRTVYWIVGAIFLIWISLLTWLTQYYAA